MGKMSFLRSYNGFSRVFYNDAAPDGTFKSLPACRAEALAKAGLPRPSAAKMDFRV